MFSYTILGTGSKANSYIIEDQHRSFLVDMGYSYKELKNRMESANYDVDNLRAVFITHLHSDHCSNSLNILLTKHPKIKVYTHSVNVHKLQNKVKDKSKIISIDSLDNSYRGFNFEYLETPHDKIQTVAFKFKKYSKAFTIATDLGCITNNLLNFVQDSNILALETNYDEDLLENGFYPYFIKERIKKSGGHLSNKDASIVVKHWLTYNRSNDPILYCVHLSENNNLIAKVEQAIKPIMTKGSMIICSNNKLYKGK